MDGTYQHFQFSTNKKVEKVIVCVLVSGLCQLRVGSNGPTLFFKKYGASVDSLLNSALGAFFQSRWLRIFDRYIIAYSFSMFFRPVQVANEAILSSVRHN